MTPHGLTFVLNRLTNATTMDALRVVWDSLGHEYKRDPRVIAFKDKRKEQLE